MSLTLGVAGNLASNVIQAQGNKIENTRAGRAMSKLGLIKPGFDERLRLAIQDSVQNFLLENRKYNLPEIHAFLEGKAFARDIKEMLFEQRGLNVEKVMDRLETYVGVPLTEAPESWPNQIDPRIFVNSLFTAFSSVLASHADEGLLWLGQAIGNQTKIIREISDKLDTALDRIPMPVGSGAYGEFLAAYMGHIAARAQRVSTPGARELKGINQSLSIAYISLNLKSLAGNEAVRAEDFLSKHSHVAIRGPAGSGKTTLLNWLITKCHPSSGDENWNGYVPFFVALRKVARLHSGPPSAERFIEYSVDNKLWTHQIPSGWVNHVLTSDKRAILMIDGVDELPASRRVEFWEWVAEFVDEYPQSRVIITSRALPGAPADGSFHEQWNLPKVFVDAQLQDMSDADVTNFIHHWHEAIDTSKLDEQEASSLSEARFALPAKLEDAANRRIRELCNTPLLCAMICVLHWKEEGYLPRQRVEVYERCCDMLIEARDLKRGVEPPPGAVSSMSKSDKEMVLQQLAIEMMHNRDDVDSAADDSYRIEISREKALAWIRPRITRFQSSEARHASADEVLDFLVERTGLLREPAKDLIDFPHRTFQEYLAACAAGADSQEAMLARQVDDDQWHETIMLAAGTNTGGVGFGQRLIDTLIRRGERNKSSKERSQKIRKTCFALALGCLENLRQQDEQLRENVLAHLSELVPPRGEGDARILSVAGDAAVSHLSYAKWKDENTATVAACARALRLIGTTEAMKALGRGYVSDARYPVISEVCRTGHFPFHEIPLVAEEVSRTKRIPPFASFSDLNLILELSNLKEIELDVSETKGLEEIGRLVDLKSAAFDRLSEKSHFLENLPSLETIRLEGNSLPNGNWISKLSSVSKATIIDLPEHEVKKVISGTKDVSDLAIVSSDFGDCESIQKLDKLRKLYLSGLPRFNNIAGLQDHNALNELVIEDCVGVSEFPLGPGLGNIRRLHIEQPQRETRFSGRLEASCSLRDLHLSQFIGLENLESFAEAKNLERLALSDCRAINDIDVLLDLRNLRELELELLNLVSAVKIPTDSLERLNLHSVSTVTGDSFLGELPALNSINIGRCIKIESLDFLKSSAKLSSLRLSMMPRIGSLASLTGLKHLVSVELIDCDGITSLDELAGSNVEELAIVSMDGLTDVEAIRSMSSLKTLTIDNCDGIKDLSFAENLDSLETIWLSNQTDPIHIPESLSPKVTLRVQNRYIYYRHRKPWWPAEPWMLPDVRQLRYARRWTRA